MCFGALIHARVEQVFYAAEEQRAGVLVSQLQLANTDFYNHQIQSGWWPFGGRIGCTAQAIFSIAASLKSDCFGVKKSTENSA